MCFQSNAAQGTVHSDIPGLQDVHRNVSSTAKPRLSITGKQKQETIESPPICSLEEENRRASKQTLHPPTYPHNQGWDTTRKKTDMRKLATSRPKVMENILEIIILWLYPLVYILAINANFFIKKLWLIRWKTDWSISKLYQGFFYMLF